jgi:hypothetical protein
VTSRVELAIDGYVQLAEYLVGQWQQLATDLAEQVQSRTIDPNAMMKTAKNWMATGAQSVALVVNEAFDAGAAMSGAADKPHVVVSTPFDTNGAGTAAHGARTLELAGPLVADLGHDSIPASAVTLRPDTLQPQQTSFELVVNGTGHAALGYSGRVNVVDAQGTQMEVVDVWVST